MFRIKKLDLFIIKQFLLLFAAAFLICQFVLMMQFLWRYVDELIGKGLTLDILGKFFWYMGLLLVPQALPLAILLSALITFGNLGESVELTAIKAAGISLMQSMRSLIVIVLIISGISYYFLDIVGPKATLSFYQIRYSLMQANPELEIPEGMFYNGIKGSNIYVQRKDPQSGHLYGVMIYQQTQSYEDQAIILADSGMIQSTAEKKHLVLTLWDGEWFENMRSQDVAGGNAQVPYRRESFAYKKMVLDYDATFNLADPGGIASHARSKTSKRIVHDLDSIRQFNDSLGRSIYREALAYNFYFPTIGRKDSLRAFSEVAAKKVVFDSLLAGFKGQRRLDMVKEAARNAQIEADNLVFKGDYVDSAQRQDRIHELELLGKITQALSCIYFFFIGAPLGAIIRKGGLGVPVIISVFVFIVYYILNNSGMTMARSDEWTVWFGRWIPTIVLAPLAIFVTYKANNDSTVFNVDLYKSIMYRMLGLREKRHIFRKEVIINDPDYLGDSDKLQQLSADIDEYSQKHKLLRWPNPIHVFFRPGDDQRIQTISDELETVIEDLGNSRDKVILNELNNYPILATHAHTRPFRRTWMNIITGLLLPVGIFFYFRMLRFRLRLYQDLRVITRTNEAITNRISELYHRL